MIRPRGLRMEMTEAVEFMIRLGENVGASRNALPSRVHGSDLSETETGSQCSPLQAAPHAARVASAFR